MKMADGNVPGSEFQVPGKTFESSQKTWGLADSKTCRLGSPNRLSYGGGDLYDKTS